jgi:hypothetical protein
VDELRAHAGAANARSCTRPAERNGSAAHNPGAQHYSQTGRCQHHTELARRSGHGQAKLPPLELAPFATQQLQIGAMQKQLAIPDDAHWALVSLTTPASPDDLVAVASSYDASGKYNLETLFSSNVAGHFAGGEWRADLNHNQIMAVTNSGQKATNALLTLHYDNGEKKYEMQQSIQPGDQMWVNVGSLIRNRTPDRKGNALPADATFGTYDLRDLSPGLGSLMEGNLALDATFGFNAAPPYGVCCGTDNPTWDPGAIDLGGGGFLGVGINGSDECNGNTDDISPDFTNWWSANPGVAQVTYRKVQAEATGTTTGSASGSVMEGVGSYYADDPVQVQVPITVAALPTNFRQTNAQDAGSGNLKFTYEWDSTSGNISDLSQCSVREYVTYPGTGNFNWSSPPYDTSGNPTANPTVSSPPFAGTDGGVIDNNLHPGFLKPYVYNQFTAMQKFQYSCTNYLSGAWQDFSFGTVSIARTVQNSPPWTYSIVKSGTSASTNLP